ncbi:MAG: isoprenylcysteine carboxylmethyltransferase family protein [Chloroflexota bacterium]
MTALKSLIFFLLVPGLLVGYLPYWLTMNSMALFDFGVLRWIAVPFWFIGSVTMVWCFYDFTFKGRGTPAPIDPPKELVASGPYRFVRNPMYVAGIVILLGYVLWRPSLSILVMPSIFFVAAHLFVTLYEEPTLRGKFGASYEEYLRSVPRWIPRRPLNTKGTKATKVG